MNYDTEAEKCCWFAPELVFGLSYKFMEAGQSVLDIGIGTGLSSELFRKAGLNVHGMDISEEMLDACREKGYENLQCHDIMKTPYPYADQSMDHVVCSGVMHFFENPEVIFVEASRIVRKGGVFAFVTADRQGEESLELTGLHRHLVLYRFDMEQVGRWLDQYGFDLQRDIAFTVFTDGTRTVPMRMRAYVGRKRE